MDEVVGDLEDVGSGVGGGGLGDADRAGLVDLDDGELAVPWDGIGGAGAAVEGEAGVP